MERELIFSTARMMKKYIGFPEWLTLNVYIEEKQADLAGNRSGNDTKDAYARLLERLSCFSREFSIESRLYGGSSYYVDTTIEVEDPKTHEKTMVPTKEFHVGTGATDMRPRA